ncbi:hypothetical protein MRX96_056028 [Rhipicephalus microplus]
MLATNEGGDCSEDGGSWPPGCLMCRKKGHMTNDCKNKPLICIRLDGKPIEASFFPPSLPTDENTLLTISTGFDFDECDTIPLDVHNLQFRMSFTSVEEVSLMNLLLDLRHAKYVKPTPVHKCSVIIALAVRNLIGCVHTGS